MQSSERERMEVLPADPSGIFSLRTPPREREASEREQRQVQRRGDKVRRGVGVRGEDNDDHREEEKEEEDGESKSSVHQ